MRFYRACETISVWFVAALCLFWLYLPFLPRPAWAAEPISIKVKTGTVTTIDEKKDDGTVVPGKTIDIGRGTFLPDPHDQKLAKAIMHYQKTGKKYRNSGKRGTKKKRGKK